MGKFIGLLYYVLWAVYAGLKISGVVGTTWFVVWAFAWGPFAATIASKVYLLLVQVLDYYTGLFKHKNKTFFKKP